MNDEQQKILEANKELLESVRVNCNHVGKFNPASQSVVVNQVEVLVITTQNCSHCGFLLTNMHAIGMQAPTRADEIIKPEGPKFTH